MRHIESPPDITTAGPREGLPPCQSFATLENRLASLIDTSACNERHSIRQRFYVVAGTDGGAGTREHGEYPMGHRVIKQTVLALQTDDPDEAQAAFERGATWVRTGVLG